MFIKLIPNHILICEFKLHSPILFKASNTLIIINFMSPDMVQHQRRILYVLGVETDFCLHIWCHRLKITNYIHFKGIRTTITTLVMQNGKIVNNSIHCVPGLN